MYPSYYKEIVALDTKRDAALRVKPFKDLAFARDEKVLPALLDEMPTLVKEYPVVFTSHENPVMVTVLGHKTNKFLDEEGKWSAGSYVPLILRIYPFAGLEGDNGEMVFCIDRKFSGIAKTGGEKIFANKEGALTTFGKNAATMTNAYVQSLKKTALFAKKLKELDLLIPASVTVTKQEEKFQFSGLMQVNFVKLAELPHASLVELIKSNELYYLYLHQLSLTHFANVV